MARIRHIKPDFWTDEAVVECSLTARLLFIGLWNFADDDGRMLNRPKQIKMQIFPGDDISSMSIHELLNELYNRDLIILYKVEDKELIQIKSWHHQVIQRPKPSKYPGPDPQTVLPLIDGSLSAHWGREGNGRGGEGRERKNPPPHSITVSEDAGGKNFLDEDAPQWLADTGLGQQHAKSTIARWRADHPDDVIADTIRQAQVSPKNDPAAWIGRVLTRAKADGYLMARAAAKTKTSDGGWGYDPEARPLTSAEQTKATQRAAVKTYRDKGLWTDALDLGTAPGTEGCTVQADILAEFEYGTGDGS